MSTSIQSKYAYVTRVEERTRSILITLCDNKKIDNWGTYYNLLEDVNINYYDHCVSIQGTCITFNYSYPSGPITLPEAKKMNLIWTDQDIIQVGWWKKRDVLKSKYYEVLQKRDFKIESTLPYTIYTILGAK